MVSKKLCFFKNLCLYYFNPRKKGNWLARCRCSFAFDGEKKVLSIYPFLVVVLYVHVNTSVYSRLRRHQAYKVSYVLLVLVLVLVLVLFVVVVVVVDVVVVVVVVVPGQIF